MRSDLFSLLLYSIPPKPSIHRDTTTAEEGDEKWGDTQSDYWIDLKNDQMIDLNKSERQYYYN